MISELTLDTKLSVVLNTVVDLNCSILAHKILQILVLSADIGFIIRIS